MTEAVRIDLAGGGYQVVIGPGLARRAGELIRPLARRGRLALVTDSTVAALHLASLTQGLERAGLAVMPIIIEPGEAAKSFAGLERLCERLLELEVERGDLVCAFGGGVVGDLAGFAAAILKRGVDYVQIPTTLLAQVDSSVGGKTAIDTPLGKNLVGAFHQPRLVLADLDLLATLPPREMRCGYAEVLKYGLIGDAGFFGWLETNGAQVLAREPQALAAAVKASVAMKAAVVAEDEREGGARALLNLGHTFGHALEAQTAFSDALRHGEAVGLGCALAFRFSSRLGLCTGGDAERAAAAIASAGLPTRLCELGMHPLSAGALIAHMAQDKKAQGGRLTFILARAIGRAFVARDVDQAAVREFLVSEGADR